MIPKARRTAARRDGTKPWQGQGQRQGLAQAKRRHDRVAAESTGPLLESDPPASAVNWLLSVRVYEALPLSCGYSSARERVCSPRARSTPARAMPTVSLTESARASASSSESARGPRACAANAGAVSSENSRMVAERRRRRSDQTTSLSSAPGRRPAVSARPSTGSGGRGWPRGGRRRREASRGRPWAREVIGRGARSQASACTHRPASAPQKQRRPGGAGRLHK